MGKHGTEYARVEKDHYPSPDWVTEALAQYVELKGRRVWECACGDGRMAEALKRAGAHVYATDVADYGYPELDELLDFTLQQPKIAFVVPRIITNPPSGKRTGKLAVRFAETGLRHIGKRGLLALLLPADFHSAASRRHLFTDCEAFAAKIVLNQRIVWFDRTDGKKEAPRENHSWFVWQCPRQYDPPVLLYADPTAG